MKKLNFKNLLFIILILWIPAIIFIIATFVIGSKFNISPIVLFQDFFHVTGKPVYTGLVSNVGIMFWSMTVGIIAFAVFVLYQNNVEKPHIRFFFFSSILTIVLLLDDFFLLHENIFPRFLGIEPQVTYAVYILFTLIYFLAFLKYIFKTNYLILLTAFLLFFLSIVLDEVRERFFYEDHWIVYEDACKLLGILSWFSYFFLTASDVVKQHIKKKDF